jgi:hypothetical protein
MMSELRPKYLLDACVPLGLMELWSGEYAEVNKILPQGSPDENVLIEAKRRGLIVITCDKGFVQRALYDYTPIIWQNHRGDRFLIECKLVTKGHPVRSLKGKRTRDLLRRDSIVLP